MIGLAALVPQNIEIYDMPVGVRSQEHVSNYTQFWQKDSAKDTEEHRAIRFDKYTDLVNGETSCYRPFDLAA